MLIVEGVLDSPILEEALQAVPGTSAVHEQIYAGGDDIHFLFWATGPDLEAFGSAVEGDPTVEASTVLVESGDRRLYRVRLAPAGRDVVTFPTWGDLNLVLLDLRGTVDGWQLRFYLPDRDRLLEFIEACEARDLRFSVGAIYTAAEDPEPAGHVLTGEQREALRAALEMGYFDVPRSADLADVADRLGRSSQATSERLRRGMARLLEATMGMSA